MNQPAFTDAYFMSPPSRGWALRGRANFRSATAPQVNAWAARREWLELATLIEELGGHVVALTPPNDELTGMPYAAECGHVVTAAAGSQLFLLPRMRSEHRQKEQVHFRRLSESMGLRPVELGGGTWEAQGDVAEFRDVTLLFHGGRTDLEGARRASEFFLGETLFVEIREPAFHGNMALLPVPFADKLLICPDVIVRDSLDALMRRFGESAMVALTEEEIRSYATNGLLIGDTLLAPSITPPRVIDLVKHLGISPKLLPMRELCEKAGGASRCLVSKARLPTSTTTFPEETSLARIAAEIRSDPLT